MGWYAIQNRIIARDAQGLAEVLAGEQDAARALELALRQPPIAAGRAAARHDVSFRDRCKGLLRRAQEARRKRTRRYLANRTEIDSLRAEVRARLRSHSPATDDDRALLRRLALLLTGSAARQAVQDVPWRG